MNKFPEHFIFGAATAAYQAEGALSIGNRGKNYWDDYLKRQGRLTLVKQVISIIVMQKTYKHVISLASMAFGFRLPGLGSFLVGERRSIRSVSNFIIV